MYIAPSIEHIRVRQNRLHTYTGSLVLTQSDRYPRLIPDANQEQKVPDGMCS